MVHDFSENIKDVSHFLINNVTIWPHIDINFHIYAYDRIYLGKICDQCNLYFCHFETRLLKYSIHCLHPSLSHPLENCMKKILNVWTPEQYQRNFSGEFQSNRRIHHIVTINEFTNTFYFFFQYANCPCGVVPVNVISLIIIDLIWHSALLYKNYPILFFSRYGTIRIGVEYYTNKCSQNFKSTVIISEIDKTCFIQYQNHSTYWCCPSG